LKDNLEIVIQYLEKYSEVFSIFKNIEQKNHFKLNINLKKLKSK